MLKRVTIKDVARYANVSTATVSRVVNNFGTVTSKNREKVKKAIKELNYYSNSTASNLKKNSSNVIGIIIPTLTNDFFMELVKGIEDHFEYPGYVFYIASSKDTPHIEKSILQKLLESNAEAIVMATIGGNDDFIKEILQLDMNIISVDRKLLSNSQVDYIGENNYESAYGLAMDFVNVVKQKPLVVIGGFENLSIGKERTEGTLKALKESKREYEFYDGKYSEQVAREIFKQLTVKYPEGCGIISLNNTMTAGLIEELYNFEGDKELFLIASYGQIPFQDIFKTNIVCSVRQYPYEIGREAANLLKEKINRTGKATADIEIENTRIIY